MKNKRILIILGIILLIIILSIVGFITINNNKNDDAIKFKKEYEELNGKINSNNQEYKKLKISKNNPIKYSNYDEILNIIEKGTGVIYLGFPACPWCRSALPVLFDAAKENDIDTIYYLNIYNERDSYIVENDKLVYDIDENGKEKKGTEGYHKLLKALDSELTEYTISFNGKIYKTGEKRLYAPSVIFVKNGKIIDLHVSTVESHKSGYDKLTDEQYEELYNIYEEDMLEMKKSSCEVGSAC